MPTYSFVCDNPKCNFEMEKYVSIKYPKKSECPQCHKKTFIRCIGSGIGIVFKGTGWTTNDKQIRDAIKENNKMNQERIDRAKEDSEF